MYKKGRATRGPKSGSINRNTDVVSEDGKVVTAGIHNYNYKGIEEINALTDYKQVFSQGFLQNLIAKHGSLSADQLMLRSKDINVPMIERQVMEMWATAQKTNEQTGVKVGMYLHDRLFGKVPDVVEYSGPEGKPMEFSIETAESSIENMLESMTDNEIVAFQKATKLISGLKRKHSDCTSE